MPPTFWPKVWTLENYIQAFTRQPFLLYIKNSFVIAILSTIIAITVGSLASYSISRTRIKFKKVYLIILLSITLLPPITIINPIYLLMRSLNLLNTYLGLAIVNIIFALPLAVWFL